MDTVAITSPFKDRSLDEVTGAVIGASIRIHKDLGSGLLESVYEAVLARMLEKRGFAVSRQQPIPINYCGMHFDHGFRADLVVDARVIVEIKSVEKVAEIHSRQLLTYLRLASLPVGLLVNFGAATLIQGVHRIVNDLNPLESRGIAINRRGIQ